MGPLTIVVAFDRVRRCFFFMPITHHPRFVAAQAVAVVQRSMRGEDPARMMADLGFGPLLLITNFPVKMSGSGRSFQVCGGGEVCVCACVCVSCNACSC